MQRFLSLLSLVLLSFVVLTVGCAPRSAILTTPDGIEVVVQGITPTATNVILSIDVLEGQMNTSDPRCTYVENSWSCLMGDIELLQNTRVRFTSESARYTCLIAYIDKGAYLFAECPIAAGG